MRLQESNNLQHCKNVCSLKNYVKMIKWSNAVDATEKPLHILGAQKFDENNVKSTFCSKKYPQFSADQLQRFLGVSGIRGNDWRREWRFLPAAILLKLAFLKCWSVYVCIPLLPFSLSHTIFLGGDLKQDRVSRRQNFGDLKEVGLQVCVSSSVREGGSLRWTFFMKRFSIASQNKNFIVPQIKLVQIVIWFLASKSFRILWILWKKPLFSTYFDIWIILGEVCWNL